MEGQGGAGAKSSSSDRPVSAAPRDKWALTQEAFDQLLASLDPDRDRAAGKYLEFRKSLIRFFEWRDCLFPEDHADETINRVAKRLNEGEEIRDPASYFFGAARMLLLEIYKERAKESQALSELAGSPTAPLSFEEELEPRVECLRQCLEGLSADDRPFILQYYQGEKNVKIHIRQGLAARFKVSLNTLRMRALRLREKLQACVEDCLKKGRSRM
jgi:DNA-directed RNA polymerase specialized sigma24 family protein